MDIRINLSNSYYRYFNTLSKLGYKSFKDIKILLVGSYIEELLMGKFTDSINEDDFKSISKCLNCLYGESCLINFPKSNTDTILPKNYITIGYRYSENNKSRNSEEELIRAT